MGDLHCAASQAHPTLLLEEGTLCPERFVAKCILTDLERHWWKSKSELFKGFFLCQHLLNPECVSSE